MIYAQERAGIAVAGASEQNALARRTNTGDLQAADLLLSQNLPELRILSRVIAGRAMDAEDLLSSALLTTWEKWTQGRGPVEKTQAYIAQSMRNRLRDEMRSPRSHNVALDPHEHEFFCADETDRVHAQIDHSIVALAMSRLSAEQRMLLNDVIVDGRKPHTLGAELGRSAAVISTAVYRAKAALRTELVVECLRRACTDEHCAAEHRRVAGVVAAKSTWDDACPEVESVRRCPACSAGLEAYAVLAGVALVR
ncbi:RNA polymerase sigma factor [Microbacterium sp. NPDC087665]|uniref:RNA polymerase sigma factor n=1 Tax=Microbacterium sp. NPDC087665 TaxID=3364194 RepID=UPI003822F25B